MRDFVLNESLDWFSVDMYLAFIVERETKLQIPFMVSAPLATNGYGRTQNYGRSS